MQDVEVRIGADDAQQMRGEWNELAQAAAEKNVFFEPFMLIPAMRHLNDCAAVLVVVRRRRKLIGLFPVAWRQRWRGLPLAHHSLWYYRHCYLTTPLVHREHAAEAMALFLHWIKKQRPLFGLFEFEFLAGDGPVFAALSEAARRARRSLKLSTDYRRAVLQVQSGFDAYWAQLGSRRNLKKKLARIAQYGEIKVDCLGAHDDIQRWTDDFLVLESKGWKGQEGTAMACRLECAAFFREVLRAAIAEDKVLMQRMSVGSRTIAMKCNFLSGAEAFCFKIAYDDDFKEASPGLLLEVENLRQLFDRQTRIRCMDSCAAPHAPLFEHLWRDGRRIVSGEMMNVLLIRAIKLRTAGRRLLPNAEAPRHAVDMGRE